MVEEVRSNQGDRIQEEKLVSRTSWHLNREYRGGKNKSRIAEERGRRER